MKKIFDFQNIKKTLLSFLELIIWFVRQCLRENFTNYNKYMVQGEPLYILGNGPSLTEFIKTTKEPKRICVVNFSGTSSEFKLLKPQYYILLDPYFFKDPLKEQKLNQLFNALKEVNWNMFLYIPFYARKSFFNEFKGNPFIKIIPFHTNVLTENMTFVNLRNFIFSKGLAVPQLQNVIAAAIFNMINKGYKTIYLYGVDHSWTQNLIVNKDNIVCLKDIHYYDNNSITYTPWYKSNNETYKMHEILRDLANMFISYHTLNDYAKFRGVQIVNKTPNSFIDAFKKE